MICGWVQIAGKGGGWLNCDVGSTSLHHVLDKWCRSPELIHCTIATNLRWERENIPFASPTCNLHNHYNHPGIQWNTKNQISTRAGIQWNTKNQISTRAFPLGAGPPPCSKYSGIVVSWSFLCVRVLSSSSGVCLNWTSPTYPIHVPSSKFTYIRVYVHIFTGIHPQLNIEVLLSRKQTW